MGFALFKVDNRLEDHKLYGGNKIKFNVLSEVMKYLNANPIMPGILTSQPCSRRKSSRWLFPSGEYLT